MKKILCVLCVPWLLLGRSELVSTIPPTPTVVINTETDICEKACMEKLLQEGLVFSFIGRYTEQQAQEAELSEPSEPSEESAEFERSYQRVMAQLKLAHATTSKATLRLAFLLPQRVIGRYAISTVNSAIAYLLAANIPFEIESFDCAGEAPEAMEASLRQIEAKGFAYVIAPLTLQGAQTLRMLETSTQIFVPTVHRSLVADAGAHLFFGGIDYVAQMRALLPYSESRVALFSDGSLIAQHLDRVASQTFAQVTYEARVDDPKSDFKRLLKGNGQIPGASVVLNTPLVTSSLIAAQIRYFELAPYSILSTQINYDPMLLNLTQYQDRKSMYIANSIPDIHFEVEESNAVMGNRVRFDWIDYSTAVGTEFFASLAAKRGGRFFAERMLDNQIHYAIAVTRPTMSGFAPARE